MSKAAQFWLFMLALGFCAVSWYWGLLGVAQAWLTGRL